MAILDWKDATGRSIPAALDYFTLTGQIGLPVADTADGGEEPNLLEAAGRVILTPTITETRFMGTVNEDPVTLPLVKIALDLNRAGQVYVVDGVAGARILNPADPQLNPSGWGYRVSIEFDEVDDLVRPTLAPFVFTVPEPKPIGPDGARDHWVLDLTNLADVPSQTGGELLSVESARALAEGVWESARRIEAKAVEVAGQVESAKATVEDAKRAAEAAQASAGEATAQATASAASVKTAQEQVAASATAAAGAARQAAESAAAAATAERQATASAASAAEATQRAGAAATDLAAAKASLAEATAQATASAQSAATAEQQATASATSAATATEQATASATSAATAEQQATASAASAKTAETHAGEAARWAAKISSDLDTGLWDVEVDAKNSRLRIKPKGTDEWYEWVTLPKGDKGTGLAAIRVDENNYHLYYQLDDASPEVDAGMVRGAQGEVGPPPVITAAGIKPGDAWGVTLDEAGPGTYRLGFTAPTPEGVSEEIVRRMVHEQLVNVELLAMAGL